MICSTTSSLDNLNHDGAFLEYGMAEEEIPLPCKKNYNVSTGQEMDDDKDENKQ